MLQAHHEPTSVWTWFKPQAERLRVTLEALLAPGEEAPEESGGPLARELEARVRHFAPGLFVRLRRAEDGAAEMILTAGGDSRGFASARLLASCAPAFEGWRIHGLAPRREIPRAFAFGELSMDLRDVRFAYALGANRIVIALLADEPLRGDWAAKRAFAEALVGELLGEEDFGLSIAGVQMLDYEAWLAATPGGRSHPLGELTSAFDRIFHRAPPHRPRGGERVWLRTA